MSDLNTIALARLAATEAVVQQSLSASTKPNIDQVAQVAADAAVRLVFEHLLDHGGQARYNDTELSASHVEGLYEQLVGRPYPEIT